MPASNRIMANFNFIALLSLFPKFAIMSIYPLYYYKVIKMFYIAFSKCILYTMIGLLWVQSRCTRRAVFGHMGPFASKLYNW